MKLSANRWKTTLWGMVCGLALGLLFGCTYAPPRTLMDPQATLSPGLLRKGDKLTVTFAGATSAPGMQQLRIGDDGTITLPLLTNAIVAAGQTIGTLQKTIHNLYVPAYFTQLTVNVQSDSRFYSVQGEVRTPQVAVYPGKMTVLDAIAVAGGPTDFAKKSKVKIIRSNKTIDTVDYNAALKDQSLNLPVYPGDIVYVPRRFW